MTSERPLEVHDLRKVYQDRKSVVEAVKDVSFQVPEGQFYTLLGPSGCGKTTTMRCIAGLERPDGGWIVVDGVTVSAERPRVFIPPHRRNIGMVFQSYAIWPHLNVFENVAFPLRVVRPGIRRADLQHRVDEALSLVQLSGFEGRMATQLSGGQQQRLALARALVREPRLLLLDEPLSNLDAKLRDQLRTELRNLQRRLGITTLYVTHDQVEALSMSDTIAVMSNGVIVQEGNPRDIYQHPTSRFVADFVGATNFVDATVRVVEPGGVGRLDTPFGAVTAVIDEGVRQGDEVTLAIRPQNIRLLPVGQAGVNTFPAIVEHVTFLGEYAECRVRLGPTQLTARTYATTAVQPGESVSAEMPPETCAVLSSGAGALTATALADAEEEVATGPSRAQG